jgi:tRNA threonylcarbamoyladenosine biosynthesis protein TsaE
MDSPPVGSVRLLADPRDDVTITTQSEDETSEVGRRLAQTLELGSVVLLIGDLGAGKTAFVRGLAEGLGAGPEEVSSPTFTLMQEYRGGRVPLIHVDLYRLNDAREIDDLGLEEMGMESVLAIEWAEKLPRPVADAVEVRIEHGVGDERRIAIIGVKGR